MNNDIVSDIWCCWSFSEDLCKESIYPLSLSLSFKDAKYGYASLLNLVLRSIQWATFKCINSRIVNTNVLQKVAEILDHFQHLWFTNQMHTMSGFQTFHQAQIWALNNVHVLTRSIVLQLSQLGLASSQKGE